MMTDYDQYITFAKLGIFLSLNTSPNWCQINCLTKENRRPIHYAIESNNLVLVKYLIAMEIDLNCKSLSILAMKIDNLDLIQFLVIDCNIDVSNVNVVKCRNCTNHYYLREFNHFNYDSCFYGKYNDWYKNSTIKRRNSILKYIYITKIIQTRNQTV